MTLISFFPLNSYDPTSNRRNIGSVYEKTVVGTQVKLDQLEQGTAYMVVVQLQKKETNGEKKNKKFLLLMFAH